MAQRASAAVAELEEDKLFAERAAAVAAAAAGEKERAVAEKKVAAARVREEIDAQLRCVVGARRCGAALMISVREFCECVRCCEVCLVSCRLDTRSDAEARRRSEAGRMPPAERELNASMFTKLRSDAALQAAMAAKLRAVATRPRQRPASALHSL